MTFRERWDKTWRRVSERLRDRQAMDERITDEERAEVQSAALGLAECALLAAVDGRITPDERRELMIKIFKLGSAIGLALDPELAAKVDE